MARKPEKTQQERDAVILQALTGRRDGRPRKTYDADEVEEVYLMAERGLRVGDICIIKKWSSGWWHRQSELREAFWRGRQAFHLAISDKLRERALSGNVQALTFILTRQFGHTWARPIDPEYDPQYQLPLDPEDAAKPVEASVQEDEQEENPNTVPVAIMILPDNGRGHR